MTARLRLRAAPVVLLALALAATPVAAQDSKGKGDFAPEGRISIRHFQQIDNKTIEIPPAKTDPEEPDAEPKPNRTTPLAIKPAMTTLDVDLAMRRIRGSSLSLLVDSEYRLDSTEFFSNQVQGRPQRNRDALKFGTRVDRSLGQLRNQIYVKNAFLEYKDLGNLVDFRAGRILMTEFGQTWVDGLHVAGKTDSGLTFGGFGGLNPDPFDYNFSTDYVGGGGHVGYKAERGHVDLAANMSRYKGDKDRTFIYSRAHAELLDGLFLSYQATLDLVSCNEDLENGKITISSDPKLTSAFVNMSWWPTKQVNFRATLSTYRNTIFASSTRCKDEWVQEVKDLIDEAGAQKEAATRVQDTYERFLHRTLNQDPYHRAKLVTAFKFLDHYYAYNELDLATREFDDKSATFLAFGLRDTDFLLSKTFFHLRFRFRDNFSSDSNEVFVELRRQFGSLFTIGVSALQLTGRSLADDYKAPGTEGITPLVILRDPETPLAQARAKAMAAVAAQLDQRQDVTLLAAEVHMDVTDRLFLSGVYEYTIETLAEEEQTLAGAAAQEELDIQAFNIRLTWRL